MSGSIEQPEEKYSLADFYEMLALHRVAWGAWELSSENDRQWFVENLPRARYMRLARIWSITELPIRQLNDISEESLRDYEALIVPESKDAPLPSQSP